MADIKQAGMWLAEGRQIRRSTWLHNARIGGQSGCPSLVNLFWDEGLITHEVEFVLSKSDLTTEDWEVL